MIQIPYSKKESISCKITEYITVVIRFIVQAAGRKKRRQKAAKYIYSLFSRLLHYGISYGHKNVYSAGRREEKIRQKAAKYHETLKFKRILSNPVKIATKLNWRERH